MNFLPLLFLTVMNPVESSYTIFGSGAAEWQKALSDYLLLKKVRQGLKEEHVSYYKTSFSLDDCKIA